jgi:hypothetical protein
MSRTTIAILGVSLLLAGGAGFLTAAALGQTDEPVETVTVNIPTGVEGPPGPQGPPGPPGGTTCPTGYRMSDVLVNAPGGQIVFRTCIKN